MKLVILYGPPAAGKLTIAQELAKIADIKVFHNHQVIDMIEPIVSRQYSDFAKLIYQTQRNIIEAAVAANHTNVVTTFPYASNLERDIEFMSGIVSASRDHGAEVFPVFLKCSLKTLRRRATEPSRKSHGKITTVEVMDTMIQKYDFEDPAPVAGNTIINTDKVSAQDAALQIKELIAV